MNTLERLKLKDNTLVYLTSDQGPHLEEISVHGEVHRGYNGIYKGRTSILQREPEIGTVWYSVFTRSTVSRGSFLFSYFSNRREIDQLGRRDSCAGDHSLAGKTTCGKGYRGGHK